MFGFWIVKEVIFAFQSAKVQITSYVQINVHAMENEKKSLRKRIGILIKNFLRYSNPRIQYKIPKKDSNVMGLNSNTMSNSVLRTFFEIVRKTISAKTHFSPNACSCISIKKVMCSHNNKHTRPSTIESKNSALSFLLLKRTRMLVFIITSKKHSQLLFKKTSDLLVIIKTSNISILLTIF